MFEKVGLTFLFILCLQVRAQHQERAIDFLTKELKVYNPKDAEERVFFVSAKETLQARLQEQKGLSAHSNKFLKIIFLY